MVTPFYFVFKRRMDIVSQRDMLRRTSRNNGNVRIRRVTIEQRPSTNTHPAVRSAGQVRLSMGHCLPIAGLATSMTLIRRGEQAIGVTGKRRTVPVLWVLGGWSALVAVCGPKLEIWPVPEIPEQKTIAFP